MGSPHQQSFGLRRPKNTGWWRISSGERCYLWNTCTVHHDQWFTRWWMIGELQVMNLCSVSWEVIHMTSRAIRGLVPNLSGDNRCISSSHLPPFFLPPFPMGNHSSETRPFRCVVTDKVAAVTNCTYVHFFVCIFTRRRTRHKDKGRQGAARPSSRPWRVIHQRWIWPWRTDVVLWCTHSPWIDPRLRCWAQGAGGVVGLIRHTVRLTGAGLRGPCGSVL